MTHNERIIPYSAWALLVVFLLLSGLILMNEEKMSEQIERDHYCDMVEIYDKTKGDYGWPAYDGPCDK
jgi:hypothetical protein